MQGFYLLSGFSRNVSLVISPIDCFTGRATADAGISVVIPGTVYKKPVIKKEGYYVFTDLPKGQYEIEISGKEYFTERLTAVTDIEDIIKVEIIPNRNYRIPVGATCISGYLKKETRVFAIPASHESGIKLISHNGRDVAMFANYNIDLSNKRFALKTEENFEIFETSEKLEKNTYKIKSELKGEYRRGEAVYPVSLGKTDSKGYLLCPVRGFTETNCEVYVGTEGAGEYKRYTISYGKVNSLKED